MLFCQLHRAFRRLTRPSSPIIAKASTWCTYSLDSIIWRTFWLRRYWRWLPALLRFSNLTKLTALLCIVLAFCLSRTIDTIITQILVICLFLLSVPTPFQAAWNVNTTCCIKQHSKQINIVFVCWFRLSNLLKINAFLKSQIKVSYKK